MKLSGAAAASVARRLDSRVVGVLLHGPDASLVTLHRRDLVAAVTEGDADRLDRLDPDTLRREPALLADQLRARSFFPGRRVLLVDGARDGLSEALGQALDGLGPEDALLVVTATGVTAKGALVRLFERGDGLVAAGLYPDSIPRDDPAEVLRAEGCTATLDPEAEAALAELAGTLDAAALRGFLATLALSAEGAARITGADVRALAPARPGDDAAMEALLAAVAGGAPDRIGALMLRLSAAGRSPGDVLGAAGRHFRRLFALAADPGGAAAAVGRLRPPVWGARRDRLVAEARIWSGHRPERALRLIQAAEAGLRVSGPVPERAIAERCLIRLAILASSAPR